MSEPRVTTGNKGPGVCITCGEETDHQEFIGAYGSGFTWSALPHNAPCGLPCVGGGVKPKECPDGFHTNARPCPGCNA